MLTIVDKITEGKVKKIISHYIRFEEIDFRIDSFSFIKMIIEIEELFGFEFDEDIYYHEFSFYEDFLEYIYEHIRRNM